MPELPEIETVRCALESFITKDCTLISGKLMRPDLRFAFPPDFIKQIRGRNITKFDRHGKYLLLHLDNGLVWLIHLGMSGQIRLNQGMAEIQTPHHHAFFSFLDNKYMCFYDPRRFGFMDIFPKETMAENRFIRKLGPDPLKQKITPEYLHQIGKKRHVSVKALLMNQSVIAGIGNIYCNEALWLAKIHPAKCCNKLNGKDWHRLRDAILEIMRKAVQAGGSSFSDFSHPDGTLGYFQHQWQIYGQAGKACPRCGDAIERITQNNRASFFCAKCT